MTVRTTGSFARPFEDRRFRLLVWIVVGATGWLGVVVLGVALLSHQPPQAGFDLTLILDAGRRVAAGQSPYLAGAVSSGTQVENLFFSYPPPVAQAASLVGGLSNGVALALFGALAVVGFGLAAAAIARLAGAGAAFHGAAAESGLAGAAGSPASGGSDGPIAVVVPTLALAPFLYPFAIALLFGNVDAWFPFLYGVVLVATLAGTGRAPVWGGVAIAVAAIVKVHPGSLLVWLLVRGARDRRAGRGWPASWIALAAALVALAFVVLVSVGLGGTGPWSDYLALLRAGTSADFVTWLNVGPASQLALIVGDPSIARAVAPFVALAAVALTALVAWTRRDPLESLAWAALASLVVSPITWFHYPVVMLPFAVAAWSRARGTTKAGRVGGLLGAALIASGLAILAPVAVWTAPALVMVAIAVGRGSGRLLEAH